MIKIKKSINGMAFNKYKTIENVCKEISRERHQKNCNIFYDFVSKKCKRSKKK